VLSQFRDDEEWRKNITGELLAGSTFIVIDNVTWELRSGALERVLTAEVWRDRRLGATEQVEAPNRATWVANGNNLSVGGDLPRRCYWIRLDAQMSRPWERTGFRHTHLRAWVRAHRGELVAALLTLARAWYAAGQPAPQKAPTMGSYEDWVNIVGGILAHAGVRGFLGNQDALYNWVAREDDEWWRFLLAWESTFGDQKVTVAKITEHLSKSVEGTNLRLSLPGKLVDAWSKASQSGQYSGFARRLGWQLRKMLDVRVGDRNLHIELGGKEKHTQRPQYIVASDPIEAVV